MRSLNFHCTCEEQGKSGLALDEKTLGQLVGLLPYQARGHDNAVVRS